MKVIVDGKEEERELHSYETKEQGIIRNKGYGGPYFAVPVLKSGESFVRTIDGKVVIVKGDS